MILGVDIGSMTISAVQLNTEKEITGTFYESHHGQIGKCLEKMARQLDPGNSMGLALTSSTLLDAGKFEFADIQTALIRASRYPDRKFDHILHVGAEKFYLVIKDPELWEIMKRVLGGVEESWMLKRIIQNKAEE